MKKILTEKQLLQKRLAEIHKEEARELKETYLPQYQKKYNGTYWKMANSYSDGKSWTLYIYFEKIVDVYDTRGNGVTAVASGYKMQTDCYGTMSVEQDNHMFVHSYTTKCTKREFMAAKNKMLKRIASL